MQEEIIFSDTTKNIELYSDGTTNISREKYLALEQENNVLQAQLINITVQSNNVITALEQENKELKIKLSSTKCYLCGEGFLTPEGAELYEEKESYRSALEKIRENLVKLKTNDEDDFTYEYSEIEDKINEVLND